MRHCIFILLLGLTNLSYAQSWESMEYDSLKAGLELNPLKGFATIFNPDPTNEFPVSLRGRLFGLDAIMSGPTTFNWDPIDDFLVEQSELGIHCYIQVNIDPAHGETHLPEYLFPLVDTIHYTDPDPVNGVDDICPDWNDPDLIQAMLTFIDSLGTRYDGDDRIFLVHLGLYGMWGEWHIGNVADVRPDFEMNEINKSLIANAYLNAFSESYLLARYPENMPDPQIFGYSDGFFFGQSISPTNSFYFHNAMKLQHADLNWQNFPIGGELDPALQTDIWDSWPNTVGQDVMQCYDSIHPTWIFAHHNFTDQIIKDSDEWNNALRAQREMGYELYVDSVKLSATAGNPIVEVNIQNRGIAPIYANWDVEIAALDANDLLISLGTKKWNLNVIQPEVLENYRSIVSTASLDDGTYTLLLRVVNPLETIATADIPPLTFANEEQDQDVEGWLSVGQLSISGGNAGMPPIPVTGMTLSHMIDTIYNDETVQLIATVSPVNASNNTVTWSSNKPRTVKVDENGLVSQGERYGTALISAYTHDGGFIQECLVTFEPVKVSIPAVVEAEEYVDANGINTNTCCGGTNFVENINTGDWMEYAVVTDVDAIFVIEYRVSSDNANGRIALVTESDDTLSLQLILNDTWWEDYQLITTDAFTLVEGDHILKFVAATGGYNLDHIEFKLIANSFTFKGTIDDDFMKAGNWELGAVPPNQYSGSIVIDADCIMPASFSYKPSAGSSLVVNSGSQLTIE